MSVIVLVRPGTGTSSPKVTAQRACGTRYPPICTGSDLSGQAVDGRARMDDLRAGGDDLSEVMSAGLRPMLILVVNSRSAARPSSRRARWLIRRRSSGVPVQ